MTSAGRTGIHHVAAAWTSASPTAMARATGLTNWAGTADEDRRHFVLMPLKVPA